MQTKIKLSRKSLELSLLAIGIVINLFTFFNPVPLVFSGLLLMIWLLLPGLLVFGSIHKSIPKRSIESFLTVIGLSIAFLILGGLLINTIGPVIGIVHPLSRLPLLVTYDLLMTGIAGVALHRHKNISFNLKPNFGYKKIDVIYIAYGFICLLMMLGGSQILNNGGTGSWVIGATIALAFYIVLGILLYKKLAPSVLPIAIFFFGFSLLLSYSLRSNHVFGWDINQEFSVFQLANTAKHWAIATNLGAYNACLSITILPTVLNTITRIGGDALFKIVFQGIFALVPIAIYRFTRIILPNKDARLGFLAATIFAGQTWFIMQASNLIRQEIAMFFFSVLLIILFSKKSSYKTLGILFGLMVILSHYSTAYVMLCLFALYAILKLFVFRLYPKLFSGRVLLLFFLFTFMWQYQMTRTAGNANNTLKQTITSLPQVFSSQGIGSSIAQIGFSTPNGNTQQNINSDYQKETSAFTSSYNDLYKPTTYSSYQPVIVPQLVSPAEPIISGPGSIFIQWIGKFSKIIISEALPILGLIIVAITAMRIKSKPIIKEYALLSAASLILLIIMLVLPLLKGDYNLTRLWLQTLIIFSPLIVFAGYKTLAKFPRIVFPALATLSAVFLLYSSGIITYASTGIAQTMYSNNSGDYYMYYTSEGETLSAIWLGANKGNAPVYADQLASLKLAAYGGITNTNDKLYPSTITTNSYVYVDSTNLIGINLHYSPNNALLQYSFPNQFLSQNKDKLYTSGTSDIYK